MATPSTPSSAASPHPPVASTPGGAAATSSTLASNVGNTSTSGPQPPNRDNSFLEPIPVLWQELVPLEWAIPLTPPPQRNPASTDSGDKLSNNSQLASASTQKTATSSDQWDKEPKPPFVASLASPSLQTSTPRLAFPESKTFTPASGLGLGSPAVPQTLSSAASSISQAQTPWRVRWACFKESQVTSASAGASPTPTRLSHATKAHSHLQSGSLSPSSEGLENASRSQGLSCTPLSGLNDKGKEKARSTPLYHSAQSSSSTAQRAIKRPKYQHHELPTTSRPPYAAHASIQALFGPSNQAALDNITRLLQDCGRSRTANPFETGKRYFLQKEAPSKHPSSPGTEPALPLKDGRLPRRMAYTTGPDNGITGIELSPVSGNGVKSTRLYLFYLSQPDTLGTIGDGEVDPFELDTDLLELDFSGTFTPSDIFPSLYNDNGLYIPPTSLHPATKQSSSSATMMANSHHGAASKAPFSLSSLSIASSSNKEAVAASEAFIKAVEEIVLANVAETLTKPGSACAKSSNDIAPDGSHGPSSRDNAAAIKCGDCLYVPATCDALQTASWQCHSASANGAHSSRRSTFIRCESYYTAAGLRTSLRTTPTELELLTRPASAMRHRSSNDSRFRKIDRSVQQGETVTLCPLALPAVFSRWFGCHQDGVSFKQVAAEQDRLLSARADFQAQFGVSMDCNSPALGDEWFLCKFGEGAQLLWPASLALRLPRNTWQGDTKMSPDTVRSQMPMRLRIAIAKASSKDVHKLLFQTRTRRSKDLASWTGRLIETQSAARESHKQKGEAPAFDAAISRQVLTTPSIALSKSNEPLKTAPDATATLKPPYGAGGLDEDEFDAESEQPTWESISKKLTRITGVESLQKASPALPSAERQDATAAQSHDSVTLAEPQPASLHGDQSTLPPRNGTANAQASSKSIADIFRDFSWDNPAQSEHDNVTQLQSGRTFGAYGNPTDENMSGYGLFETTGLTDDDFSFFDSPDTAQNFQPTQANITNTYSNPLPGALSVTAVDLASIVGSSGPIDHFGHLMPKNIKTPGIVARLDYGSLGDQPISPAQHFNTPASLQSSAISMELPNLEQSVLFHTPDSILSEDKAVTSQNVPALERVASPVHCETEHAYGESDSPDRKIIAKVSSCRSPEQATGDAVAAASETGLAIYRPLPFFMPSPPSSDSDDALLGNDVSTTNVTDRLIGQTRALRAARVRSALSHIGEEEKAHSSSNRSWIPKAKHLDRGGALSSLESSDTDSDDLPVKLASREAQSSGTLDDTISGQLLHVAMEISRCVVATEAEESQADLITGSASKVSRGEKEAVTTIFMQHMAENIDFRERNYQAYPSRPSFSSAFMLRPASGLSIAQHLALASPTNISLYYHEAIMQMSITSLRYWTKLGLSPHSRPKNTQAVILAARPLAADAMKECLMGWLDCIAELWQKCGFGNHTIGSAEDVIFSLQCSKLSECSSLQAQLGEISPALSQRVAGDHNCIIYVIVEDDECYQPTSALVYLCVRLHLLRKGVTPHIVPLSLLAAEMQTLSLREGGSLHESVFLRFAFDVFDRLPISVTRTAKDKLPPSKTKPGQTMPPAAVHASRAFMAPAFKLVPRRSAQIQFALQWPPPALSIMDSHRLLHVGYHLSDDRKWLLMAAIDDHGEHHSLRARFVDGADVTHLTRRVWAFAKEFWEFASVEWRICISRMDSMPVPELQAWCDTMHASIPGLSRPSMVSILTYSRSCSMATPAISNKDGGPSRRPSIALPTVPESKYAQGQYPMFVSTTIHPSAVFTDLAKKTCVGTPKGTAPLYYSLARASVFAPAAVPSHDPEMVAACHPVGTSSAYTIDLLAVATHTLSSYNRPLSEHIADVAQSSIDLYTLARERWSFTSAFYMRGEAGPLPWHLAIINGMASYDFDSLLPT